MTTQNLWNATKVVLRGKFIAIQSYLNKQEKHWLENLILHIKQIEKEKKNKISRRNHKDPNRNKWKRNERNNRKD